MKKLVFSAFLLAGSFNVFAQTVTTSPPTQVSTNDDIRMLANRLELNEREYILLRDVMKTRNEQIAEVNSMYSNDPVMRQSKLASIDKEYESSLSKNLNTKQYTAYLESQGRAPVSTGTGLEAGGYGGRSLESGGTPAPGGTNANTAPDTTVLGSDTGNKSIGTEKADKVGTGAEEMKTESADQNMKAKKEKRKTKIETPTGKWKMEDGEVKMKTKKGKVD